MITLAPMPTWKALIFSIFTRPKSSTDLAKPWKRSDDERAGWLSRSAWSLVLLVHWRSQYKGGGSVSVWLPDYFCAESLTLLRHLNVSLYFYPITEKLIPDFPHLREKARIEPPDILMMVHYFGMPSPLVDARELCKVVGSWLVEDAAHVLTPAANIGTEGDFVIYSPHKLIALPDPFGTVPVLFLNLGGTTFSAAVELLAVKISIISSNLTSRNGFACIPPATRTSIT